MMALSSDYSAEIDTVERASWEALLLKFDDANLYQTWSWGSINWNQASLSHLVLRRDGEVIAMAQTRIRNFPLVRAGVATVFWGPLWRKKCRQEDFAILDRVIEAMKNEYVVKRGLLLRVWPIGFDETEEVSVRILQQHGFIRNSTIQPYRTLLLDLRPSMDNLRNNLSKSWRKHLSKAERTTLRLVEGTEDELFEAVTNLYKETLERKQFKPGLDVATFRAVQSELPGPLKMRIMICEYKEKPVAVLVGSSLGSTGIEFVAATGEDGLELGGSYRLRWRMIEWLKENGCCWYDLNGIDPERNPGSYQFKMGLAGKTGRDVKGIGQFFLVENPVSYLLKNCIDLISNARITLRKGFELLR